MNTTLKWLGVVSLACVLTAFGPGGCGGDEDPPAPPSTPDAGPQVTQDAGADADAGERGELGDAGGEANNDGCRTRCAIASRTLYRECLDAGGTEEQCGQRSQRQNAQCVEERCGGDEDENNGCQTRCGIASRTTYNNCVEGGGSAEDCRERARRDNARCVEERCGGGEEEDNGCETRCGIASRTTYNNCIEGGGSAEDCRERARRDNARCVEERCAGDDDDDDQDDGNANTACTTRCQQASRTQAQQCIDAGGDPDSCRQEARDYQARCIRERCRG